MYRHTASRGHHNVSGCNFSKLRFKWVTFCLEYVQETDRKLLTSIWEKRMRDNDMTKCKKIVRKNMCIRSQDPIRTSQKILAIGLSLLSPKCGRPSLDLKLNNSHYSSCKHILISDSVRVIPGIVSFHGSSIAARDMTWDHTVHNLSWINVQKLHWWGADLIAWCPYLFWYKPGMVVNWTRSGCLILSQWILSQGFIFVLVNTVIDMFKPFCCF